MGLLAATASAAAQDRFALVIGNARYPDSQLQMPTNNAKLVRDALVDLDFQVATEFDTDRSALRRALTRFGEQLQSGGGSIALLYYAGRAVNGQGTNYLMPIDARPAHGNELPQQAVELNAVLAAMQQGTSSGRLVIIDDSPRAAPALPPGVRPGLAAMRAPPGFLLAFAAPAEGRPLLPATHSATATALREALQEPGLPAEALMSRVSRLVGQRTQQQQRVWYESALGRTVILRARSPEAPPPPVGASAEARLWNSLRTTASGMEDYLRAYPNGMYADEARRLLRARAPDAVNVLGVGTVFRDCARCPQMVVVEAGSFEMGSARGPDNERPAHHVTVPAPLAVGRYEVTFEEWDACVADAACAFSPPDKGWGRERRPVLFVSWRDVQFFLEWLSRAAGRRYRLPTEAEWEYFARAGSRSAYPWGDQPGSGRANCHGCRPPAESEMTRSVGRFAANAFGLFDVIGNVAEWTQDCYVDSYERAPLDGRAQTAGHCIYRVFRGGSWYDEPERVRVGFRNGGLADLRSQYVGFRVVRELN